MAHWFPPGPVFDVSVLSDEYCTTGEFTGSFVGLICVDTTPPDRDKKKGTSRVFL